MKPQVGLRVWYWARKDDVASGCIDDAQPMAATVVFVRAEDNVNLACVDHEGGYFIKRGVTLVQDDTPRARRSGYGFAQMVPPEVETQSEMYPTATPPHQQRVIDERNALQLKRKALLDFTCTSVFRSLDATECGLLMEQLRHMTDYFLVLEKRIDNFAFKK